MIPLIFETNNQDIILGRFVDSINGDDEETGLTINNTDIKLWKQGASSQVSKNSGGASHDAGGMYIATLDETDSDTLGTLEINVHVAGALSVKQKCRVMTLENYNAFVTGKLVPLVWDEVLTGATHNVPSSSGRRLRDIASPVIISGESPGTLNTSTRIQLDSFASDIDGTYDPASLLITEGTGRGQMRQIWEYHGADRLAYVNRDFKTIPDATSKYILFGDTGDTHVNEGVARGGSLNTIKLNALASSVNNAYRKQTIFIAAGTGADQSNQVSSYNGSTKIAIMVDNWTTIPDTTSIYATLPVSIVSLSEVNVTVTDPKEPTAEF